MRYEVTAKDPDTIDFAPKNEVEEVLQNVRTILSTAKGTVPLDRQFGLDGAIIDLPVTLAKAKLTNEIFQALNRYEPRVKVEKISFSGDISGQLTPKVEVSINGSE